MHVMMLGLRGIPETEGGIERHVESLAPLLVERGLRVTALLRSPYKPANGDSPWRGVERVWLWAPRSGSLETIVNTFIGVMYAAFRRPDILHIHGIGPALLVPLARLLGLKVVMTHHGFDYDREKWGRFAKGVLKAGEAAGVKYSHEAIVISKTIRASVSERFGRACELIPNGVALPELTESTRHIERFGLVPRRYVLQVSRFVPEKRQIDLIRGFRMAELDGWKLVLVGRLNQDDPYTRKVHEMAAGSEDVVLTDFQTGPTLHELYSNAGLFVLPSSHEGLPIALLEAMSYGLPVLASGIPAHTELELPAQSYFRLGDNKELAERIREHCTLRANCVPRSIIREWVINRFNWDTVARDTVHGYEHLKPAP